MRLNDGRALPAFIGQALRGEDLTVFGDGSQTRSFCFVDDMVLGIDKLINSDKSINGPINIGNDSEYTILEIAKIIIGLTESQSKIIFKSFPEDDPLMRKPDIRLANNLLNWYPRITLKDGLIKTINYFKNLNEA